MGMVSWERIVLLWDRTRNDGKFWEKRATVRFGLVLTSESIDGQ